MALNKKEKAYLEEIEVKAALHITREIKLDVKPPPTCEPFSDAIRLTKGFLFNGYRLQVDEACSSSIYHNPCGNKDTDRQNPAWLYSTRELALRAMRYEMEIKFAKELRKIDLMIESETK